MSLNAKDWQEYKISDIFDIYTGGDLIMSNIESGNIPVASNSVENNNIACYSSIIEGRKLFDCTRSISIADRGCFRAFIQPKDFYIATRVKALVCKECLNLSINQLGFIVSVINLESFKFSYGRNCCAHLPDVIIKLPTKMDGNSFVIDENRTFSDQGFIPDWDYMEEYMKTLKYKPLTTKIKEKTISLEEKKWKEFKLGQLFKIKRGDRIVKDEDYYEFKKDDYVIPVITATTFNNGVDGYYNEYNCEGN